MKHMRKIFGILAVLMVGMALIGAGSAASAGYSDVTITPATSLTPGQTVTGVMKISVPAGTLSLTDSLVFTSPLQNVKWEYKIFKGEANKNSQNPASVVSGNTAKPNSQFAPDPFSTIYPNDDVTYILSFSGVVPESSKGKAINVINAVCSKAAVGPYTSTAQKIYNPSDLTADISSLNKEISTTEARITKYTEYGLDLSAATQSVASAKTKVSAAQAAGSGNTVTAYANIEAGDTFITNAERTISLTGLKAANSNIAQVDAAVKTLYSRNWKSEGQLLETRSTSMKYTYDTLAATYNAGGIPDAAKLDALVADSYETLAEANEYLEKSKTPAILKILPFIIGGIVAVAAVVGIVFLIRRRRANSWDELG